MLTRLLAGALHGVDAFRVDVEVEFTRQGSPLFTVVGLAEGAVREAKDRVLAALRTCHYVLEPAKVTVNLAPADRRKYGTAYDLPLALGLLASAGRIPAGICEGWFFAGELSLSGEIKPIPGILPLALLARAENVKGMVVAPENAAEAALVQGLAVYSIPSLPALLDFLAGKEPCEPVPFSPDPFSLSPYPFDFSEVKGQEYAKRAIEIAAAGGHNLLFIGPPGSGKTMLAQRIPTVLPPLSFEESLEVTKIYSVANLLGSASLLTERPFRAPHHTISAVALVGGGAFPKPGEVSLAHHGVLFLDELPEFKRHALEVLRQPLEDGKVTISRAAHAVTYPADLMLIAAMNPCPCGYKGDSTHTCTCSRVAQERYRDKISGPLLDRIDLHVEVSAVPFDDLAPSSPSAKPPRSSAQMRQSIMAARALQTARYQGTYCPSNAHLNGALLDQHCALTPETRAFLEKAMQTLALSARAFTRILRISRTIADLENSPGIQINHIAEAINCRCLDRERLL